jgi:hypothetical protein
VFALSPAHASWPALPWVNVPVCTAPGLQAFRTAVPDGASGLIVAWVDTRSDSADIYAQRVGADGAVLWESNGVRVCGALGDQDQPSLTGDGHGGAVVVWRDFRSGPTGDLYAQRLDPSGTPLWAADGIPVCTAPGDQTNAVVAPDGSGGMLLAWEDGRAGLAVYAQRLDASGTARWGPNGLLLTPGSSVAQFEPAIASLGNASAVVAWTQSNGGNVDVRMQHVNNTAVREWGATGFGPCTDAGDQFHPRLVVDGTGGVVVAWEDHRGGSGRVRAQRLRPWGELVWGPDGVEAAPANGDQLAPAIAPDGAGGAVLAWSDYRGGATSDLWAQRLDGAGARRWGASGLALCTAPGEQQFPTLAPNGSGGAMAAWEDGRAGSLDLYAQSVSGAGNPRWGANGAPLCTAPGGQYQPVAVSEGDSVGVFVWVDQRFGGSDLYAQRLPALITLDAPGQASAARLRAWPQPSRGACTLEFALDRGGPVALRVLDTAGRSVRTLLRSRRDAGRHAVAWDGRDDAGRPVPAGVYFARLSASGTEQRARLVRLGD